MLRFNTAGPCVAARNYMLPAIERLPQARGLVEQYGYFALHAPRQTGKTTFLRAFARDLTASGDFAAIAFSCETAEVAGDDYGRAEEILLSAIELAAAQGLPPGQQPVFALERWAPGQRLFRALTVWAQACPRPLVLLFDEIDALRGESLRTVLRQLRAGFADRPAAFPASAILCGLRDVRDYKAASGGDPGRLGTSSPFNVKLTSVRISDFDAADIARLYAQHTAATGQAFTPDALEHAFTLTGGQPWLVNALAREVIEEIGVPAREPIVVAHLEAAKERLIYDRQTHLDLLVARLHEPRVRRVIAPLLAGGVVGGDTYDDDFAYARDLGLIAGRPPAIANPIYREVIARVLSVVAEDQIEVEPRDFILADGRLDLRRLLQGFAGFWREHGVVLAAGVPYHEVAPQLVLMAYLQRVVNGGGYIDREYGVGRGRIDLLVRWPWLDDAGKRQWQREALELKVWADGRPDPLAKGLVQLDAYLQRLGLDEGVLVLFDRRDGVAAAEERTRFEDAVTASGRVVLVLRG